MIEITPRLSISESEIQEEFTRSSGAGGQNVNKVSTAVQLRFDVENSSLPHDIRHRLKTLAGSRMTQDGVLIIKAQTERTQERNREAALERLVDLIRRAVPPPTVRRATKPTRGSQVRRLDSKRAHSRNKQLRRKPEAGD